MIIFDLFMYSFALIILILIKLGVIKLVNEFLLYIALIEKFFGNCLR